MLSGEIALKITIIIIIIFVACLSSNRVLFICYMVTVSCKAHILSTQFDRNLSLTNSD